MKSRFTVELLETLYRGSIVFILGIIRMFSGE